MVIRVLIAFNIVVTIVVVMYLVNVVVRSKTPWIVVVMVEVMLDRIVVATGDVIKVVK